MSKRTSLISCPDMEPYEGRIKEAIDNHQLRVTTVIVPNRLWHEYEKRVPRIGKYRGLVSALYVRMINQLVRELDARELSHPGPTTDEALIEIVERKLTPLANTAYYGSEDTD